MLGYTAYAINVWQVMWILELSATEKENSLYSKLNFRWIDVNLYEWQKRMEIYERHKSCHNCKRLPKQAHDTLSKHMSGKWFARSLSYEKLLLKVWAPPTPCWLPKNQLAQSTTNTNNHPWSHNYRMCENSNSGAEHWYLSVLVVWSAGNMLAQHHELSYVHVNNNSYLGGQQTALNIM